MARPRYWIWIGKGATLYRSLIFKGEVFRVLETESSSWRVVRHGDSCLSRSHLEEKG
jgi:hypothetical protein